MIMSALISQCRREYGDMPKSVSVSRAGNGSVNLFNVGKFPVIESSNVVYLSGVTKTETTDYTYDLDNGDIRMLSTPSNGAIVKSQHKYATYRDKHWVEAANQAIEQLNARGFFRQIVRDTAIFRLSANIQTYSGPSACVDVYELLISDNQGISGNFKKPQSNWGYQQDGNKITFDSKPTLASRAMISYLRNMKTYAATSATLDVKDDWIEAVKKKAGAIYFRSLAGKIAKEGNANIDEGHFSFTNLRTMANDLDKEFEIFAARKKPTRPAKDIKNYIPGGL